MAQVEEQHNYFVFYCRIRLPVTRLQTRSVHCKWNLWGPHKRITLEAFRGAQPCGKIHQGVCAGRGKLLRLQVRHETKYESRSPGWIRDLWLQRVFCLFLSLSQRWNLAALLINHYLISNDWDIKVGRESILLLSGSILQDNSEIEHSVGRKI